MTWTDDATCRGMDTELFFPPESHSDGRPRKRETPKSYGVARQICREECPVRAECLEAALEREEPYGMWGGLTRPERNTILKRRRREAKRRKREARANAT